MLNFKIRIFDRCFAIKFSSKWLKMEKSQQVRVLSKQAKQIKQAKYIKQAKQSKQIKQP